MNAYASVNDLSVLWRKMTAPEQQRAAELLDLVSSCLRVEARKVGKDLDAMLQADADLAAVARSVVCDVTARMLMTSTDSEPMTQYSESAGGYSAAGTFLVPGGGLFIKKSELARLGLRRQKVGVIDFYGMDPGHGSHSV